MTIEQTALSLYQLLGAPLYALIEAETYAANATADFIERVGFEPPSSDGDKKPVPGDLGKLRTLTFRQERRIAEKEDASYEVVVPLLSILPVPALQIKEADLEFFVKIVDMVSASSQSTAKGSKKESKEPPEDEDLVPTGSQHVPTPPRLDMKAMLGRGQPGAPHTPQSAFDMQVHIKIKVTQADTPAGLSRLFNLLEQSVSSTRMD